MIIKGKPIADKITEDLKNELKSLKKDRNPKLSIIRVGNNPDDISYEKNAIKRCENIGIECEVINLSDDVSKKEYIDVLDRLNNDKLVDGILCLRPLPKNINEDEIKYFISDKKDVDCFNPINMAKIIEGDRSGFSPCTPMAVIETLKYYDVDLNGANVCVVGRSNIVGKPCSMLLLNENATVTICHSKTKDLESITSKADILIVAVGKAKVIKSNFVKENSVVIDVGINFEDGILCGDVDTDDVLDKVSMITPVPFGVGSVTTSILAKQVIKAYKNNI